MPIRLALVTLLALPSLALAQDHRAKPEPPAAKRFDFDDDLVEASRPLPPVEVVSTVGRHGFPSLIRVRTTFVPELLRSAEDR